MMADRLDPVAVGIPEERGIIRGVIIAQARCAVVVSAGCDAGIPERIDLGAPPRLEAPMATDGIVRLRAFADRDINPLRMCRPGALAVAEPVVAATDLDDIKHLHDRVVETLGGREIGYGDRNVVEHG